MGASAVTSSCCVSRDGHCEADESQRPISSRISARDVPEASKRPPPKPRKAPERPIPRRRAYSASHIEEGDFADVRGRLGSLSSTIGNIQDEMLKMRSANGDLLRRNDDLMGENQRLKRFLNERAASKAYQTQCERKAMACKDFEVDSVLFQMVDDNGNAIPARRACFVAAAGA